MPLSEVLSISEQEKVKILSNYGRTVETVKQDIKSIQEWFKKQPHLPEIPDDRLIEIFLILNKFKIETTKEKLDNYYSAQLIMPEIYEKQIDETFLRKLIDKIYVVPLPKLTQNLQRIVITKLKDTDPDHFDELEVLMYCLYCMEVRLREDYHLSSIYVFDCEGLGSSHLLKISPALLNKAIFLSQKITTNKIYGFHLVNLSSLAESFINVTKKILNFKLTNRIVVHSNMESFLKVILLENLPKEFGGKEKSLDELNESWKTVLVDYLPKIIAHRSLCVNEELRPKETHLEEHLGISGNFRQLSID